MVVLTQPHELAWGTLVLSSEEPGTDPWRFETIGLNASLGSPVPVVEVIESLLDGDLSVVTSYGNRQATFAIRISALDGEALAQGEALLQNAAMADQPAELSFTPPSIGAWPAVFDVVTVRLDPSFDPDWDFEETARACRYYTLTFECLPWTHAAETVVIPALPAPVDPEDPPTPTLVDACSSASGWIRKVSPTTGGVWTSLSGPTVVSGALRTSGTLLPGSGYGWLALERTGTVAMTGTPYLVVDVYEDAGSKGSISVRYDAGTPDDMIADPLAIIPTSTPGVSSYYFDAPASFDKLLLRLRVDRSKLSGRSRAFRLEAHNVDRIESIPSPDASGYQIARTAIVGGTAPTQAALRFATTLEGDPGTDELMHRTAMVYTGANPVIPLRPLLDASATAGPDSEAVSGESNDLSIPTVYLVPVNQLVEANYALLARMYLEDTKTITWSARVVDSTGAAIPGSEIVESGSMSVTEAGTLQWAIYEIAEIPMPILADLDADSTHAVEITLAASSGGALITLDEAWVADADNGAVTILNTLDSVGPYKIELRSPQLGSPRPAVIGTWQAYGSQDISRHVTRLGTHQFKPGLLHVFTVADGIKYAACELEYYERFHTYPGPALAPEDDDS